MSVLYGQCSGLSQKQKSKHFATVAISLGEEFMIKEYEIGFLVYCKSCKRSHVMRNQKCSTCQVYETPQPISEKVYNKCGADYCCDGCIAYREHTNPY